MWIAQTYFYISSYRFGNRYCNREWKWKVVQWVCNEAETQIQIFWFYILCSFYITNFWLSWFVSFSVLYCYNHALLNYVNLLQLILGNYSILNYIYLSQLLFLNAFHYTSCIHSPFAGISSCISLQWFASWEILRRYWYRIHFKLICI